MKSFHGQTFYELLEISVGASASEVRYAFDRLMRLYDEDQVVLYGLIEPEHAAALRARLRIALDTLSDDEKRDAYDVTIGLPPRTPRPPSAAPASLPPVAPVPAAPVPAAPVPAAPLPAPAPRSSPSGSSGSSSTGWTGSFSWVSSVQVVEAPAAAQTVLTYAPAVPRAPEPPEPLKLVEVVEAPALTASPVVAEEPAVTEQPAVVAESLVAAEPAVAVEPPAVEVGAIAEPVEVAAPAVAAPIVAVPQPVAAVESVEGVPVAEVPVPAAHSDTLAPTSAPPPAELPTIGDEDVQVAIVPVRTAPARDFRQEAKVKPFEIPPGVEINGDLLKQVRMARGLSMVQLSERTKISVKHLENVEGDRYDALPATVYLRGILMNLARELGLDGLRVAKSYLSFVDAHRSKG